MLILTACGNSKVDQIIKDHMESANNASSNADESNINSNNIDNNLGINSNDVTNTDASNIDTSNQDIELPGKEDMESIDDATGQKIDVDLTKLSSTMVYSQVYDIMYNPTDYVGKIIKMTGQFTTFQSQSTGIRYFACLISDATACCAQGIEFELAGNYSYPNDYPEEFENVTVVGEFETYKEDGATYCRLKDARMK